jgi:hypothetical protein
MDLQIQVHITNMNIYTSGIKSYRITSICGFSMRFFPHDPLVVLVNSTLIGLMSFVNPQNADFSLQYGI